MIETQEPSRTSAIKITLAVIPALLIVSVCIALYFGANADQEETEPVEGDITVPEMADYLLKLNQLIGERAIDTESGQQAFRQYNAMTRGTLGSENLGYEIFRSQKISSKGLLWPTIWIQAGDRRSKEPVVLAVPQVESGTAAAFAFGFAEYLTSHETKVGVRIVFYPPFVEGRLDEWIWSLCGEEGESMKAFLKVTGGADNDPETVFLVSDDRKSLFEDLSSSKIWGAEMSIDEKPGAFLEVRLVERNQRSRSEHAQKLIRMMPVMKDLVDRLGE